MTDAEMALRKEAEASRKALEALQKEMSARDSPTAEAPSNIGLAGRSRGGRNVVPHRIQQVSQLGQARQTQQPRERVGNPSSGNVITATPANQSTNATAAVANVTNSTAGGTVMTQYMEVLKEAGLPTDVPILMDSGDGSFVTVNEEVLMNIVSGGVIQCHVEEGGNIATFTPGDARVMTAEVQEDSGEGVMQAVEGQNEMENADHRELMNAKEEVEGLTIEGQVRGQDMPSVDGDEGVGEGNIAFSENETVVQEVEGKEGEGGETIYMVVEDGSGAVEGQQVISHDGVPLCKVKTETVDGKTMYLVTRGATKTMQCAISEGALVVSEGDVVQGISIASDVELERDDKGLVKKVEYEKLVNLPSLEDNDGSMQDTVVPTPQEDKSAEGADHVTELPKSSEEMVSMASNDAVTESDAVHEAEGKDKMKPSGEFEDFVTEVASVSSDIVSNKRKSLEDPLPSLANKRMKEVEDEGDGLVLVLREDEIDENSANAGENQREFIITSSENAEVCKEQLQDSLSSAVGDFQGKVELTTGPRREGRSLPMLQDSDEDIKSSTM
ncbi:hypothetical protein J437_LFUL014582 [Ladona fulva]|uniref:Uncharacterized protein n=1 Tax=Ladona fulva TaxID=123851 RepID=A0A8K0KGD5_LADFU|nr:hypothetical protein J437_LFUL014582 [Ladona fulva]